jgi:hypothetical protein
VPRLFRPKFLITMKFLSSTHPSSPEGFPWPRTMTQ